MIRILSNTYTKKEKIVLNDLLNEMSVMFHTCYCRQYNGQKQDCETCDVRHICYDVEKIAHFSEDLIDEKTDN